MNNASSRRIDLEVRKKDEVIQTIPMERKGHLQTKG